MELKRKLQNKKTSAINDAAIKSGLMKIYSNADGTLPDISHLEVHGRSRLKTFFIGAIVISVVLAAAAWLGFLLFGSSGIGDNKSISLNLSGPESVASGDEIIYVLEYKNIDRVDLENVEIIFRYPDKFSFVSADPTPTNNFDSSWSIGSLARGQSGRIEIRGRLIGEVGSIQPLNVTAQFKPANFSSMFKETATINSQITSSILAIDLLGPEKILAEKKVEYKISYSNTSDHDLSNIKIILTYPEQFVYQSATPTPQLQEATVVNANKKTWVIPLLEKQAKGEIIVTGGFSSDEQATQATLVAQIGFAGETDDDFSPQQEKSFITEIIRPNLSLSLIINGSSESQPINFGDELTYSIIYKNLGQEDLSNISISVTVDGDIIDWQALSDQHGGKRSGGTITWTKEQVSSLDVVRSLTEGKIDFTVTVKEGAGTQSGVSLAITSKASAIVPQIGELESEPLKVESNEIKNNINTDITLRSQGRYFDDDNIPVGSGPLPPVVGQKTTFRVYWDLANSVHGVKDVVISTVLPQGVSWENKFLASVGSIAYSPSSRTISWKIGSIAPNKGFDSTKVWFDISVVPTKQQVRKLIILADQTTLTARDTVTDSVITKVVKAITSNLEDDPIGGGRGLVIDISQ